MRSVIRTIVLSFIIVSMMLLTGCSGESEHKSDADKGNAQVTSEWEYYSLKTDSDTYYRTGFDRDEDLPFFRSSDGETCEFSTVKGKSYKALITDLGDGHYKLSKPGASEELDMQIEDDRLMITFPNGQVITFVKK